MIEGRRITEGTEREMDIGLTWTMLLLTRKGEFTPDWKKKKMSHDIRVQ